MILPDHLIERAIKLHKLRIDPLFRPIQPASVDLRLGSTYVLAERGRVDPAMGYQSPLSPMNFVEYVLQPGQFVNMNTLEWIEISSGLIGVVTGKSSLARLGIQIEAAGYVDPGWRGRLTLEIVNLGPSMIVLRPGMPICQIRFEHIDFPQHLYGDPTLKSHYQNSTEATPARFDWPTEDFSETENLPEDQVT